ncbi:MAG: hypothetical protein H6839_13960 [Planctomycetes bacterium]|nr:hypothetical protein [Planctomycetota bacterium]
MSSRLLHFRFTFALLGVVALLAGAYLETVWLAGPGAVVAGVSDAIGLMQARARFSMPLDRTFRGAAEWLPALGVAAYQPYALMLAVAVVLYALFASGMQTVSLARGTPLKLSSGETLRRILTSFANLVLLTLPFTAMGGFDLGATLGSTPQALCVVCGAVGLLAGMRALLDMLISVKVGPATAAPNVDT